METFFQYAGSLDYVAVAVSAVVMWLLGLFWYSPVLFGRTLMRLSGVRPGDIHPQQQRLFRIVNILTTLMTAVLLGVVARYFGVGTGTHEQAIETMLDVIVVLWMFIMLNQLRGFIWRREPFQMFLLQTLLTLAALVAGSLVFCFWS